MNPKELVTVASLLLVPVCPQPIPAASVSAAHVAQPARLPDDKPEPAEPPHGEGSGESPISVGVASGAMNNTASAVMMTPFWEPPTSIIPLPSRPHLMLKVTSAKVKTATPQRPLLPRARRSC